MENRGVLIVFVIIVLAIFVSSVNQDLAGLAVSKGPFLPKQEQSSFSWQDSAGSSSPAGGSGGGSSGGGSSAGGTCPKGLDYFASGSPYGYGATFQEADEMAAKRCEQEYNQKCGINLRNKKDAAIITCIMNQDPQCDFSVSRYEDEKCTRSYCNYFHDGRICVIAYDPSGAERWTACDRASRGGYTPLKEKTWECTHDYFCAVKTACTPELETNDF